jgi:hypothetical protein
MFLVALLDVKGTAILTGAVVAGRRKFVRTSTNVDFNTVFNWPLLRCRAYPEQAEERAVQAHKFASKLASCIPWGHAFHDDTGKV